MDEQRNNSDGSSPAGEGLSDAEKEDIRTAEVRDSEERRYRAEVRREISMQDGRASLWDRIVSVLKIEDGVFSEIASDGGATLQAILVFAVASTVGSLWSGPFLLITVPIALVFVLVGAAIYSLISRLFASEVAPLAGWIRALLFTSIPSSLGIVPIVGSFVGGIYTLILQIVVIRELARVSTGKAVAVWLITVLVVVLPVIVLAGIFVGFAIFSGPLWEVLDF